MWETLSAVAGNAGPWVLFLSTVTGVTGAVVKGTLVPATHVDRIVGTYETMLTSEKENAAAWKAAHALEAENARMLREQNGKLLEHSSVSAHAWDGIRAAAERAGTDAA